MFIQYKHKSTSIFHISLVCLFFTLFFQKGYWYWILILQFFWHTDTDTYSVFFRLNTDTDTSVFENHTGYCILVFSFCTGQVSALDSMEFRFWRSWGQGKWTGPILEPTGWCKSLRVVISSTLDSMEFWFWRFWGQGKLQGQFWSPLSGVNHWRLLYLLLLWISGDFDSGAPETNANAPGQSWSPLCGVNHWGLSYL